MASGCLAETKMATVDLQKVKDLSRLLYKDFHEELTKEFDKFSKTLEGNASTLDHLDYGRFKSLLGMINWKKAPATVAQIVYNYVQIFKDTKKAEKMKEVLVGNKLDTQKTAKETAKGLLDIIISYEFIFVEALTDANGKIHPTFVKQMAYALVGIVLKYLTKESIEVLTSQDIIDAVKNYILTESTKKTISDAISKGICAVVKPSGSTQLSLKFRKNEKSALDPKNIIYKPLILDAKKLSGEGQFSHFAEKEYYYKKDMDQQVVSAKKILKYGFRLTFPGENIEDYKKITPKDIKEFDHEKELNYNQCQFLLAKLNIREIDDLVDIMLNLNLEDTKLDAEVKQTEEVKDVTEEILKIVRELTGSTSKRGKKVMLNEEEEFEDADTEFTQEGDGDHDMTNRKNKYKRGHHKRSQNDRLM